MEICYRRSILYIFVLAIQFLSRSVAQIGPDPAMDCRSTIPPSDANANMDEQLRSNRDPGSVLIYRCVDGFSYMGEPTYNFTCNVNTWYDGVFNGRCEDNDECTLNTDDCDANAYCINSPGSFACTCKPGFVGDGTTCTEANLCTTDNGGCDPNALCIPVPDSVICMCPEGYTGTGTVCTVKDCGTPSPLENAQEVGSTTTFGSEFIYTCSAGYRLPLNAPSQTITCRGTGLWDPLTQCIDVNECMDPTLNNCDPNADCVNEAGSFSCKCKLGFSGNGIICSGAGALGSTPFIPHTLPINLFGADLMVGDEVIVQLEPGYFVVNPDIGTGLSYDPNAAFKIFVTAEGTWGPMPLPVIAPVDCGAPVTVPNAVMTGTKFTFDSKAVYECADGFHVKSSSIESKTFFRKCQADGTWTYAPDQVCVDINECTDVHGTCGTGTDFCLNIPGSYICLCRSLVDRDGSSYCTSLGGLLGGGLGDLLGGGENNGYDACDVLSELGQCQHGDCVLKGSQPSCNCLPGYEGVACDRATFDIGAILGVCALVLGVLSLIFVNILCVVMLTRTAAKDRYVERTTTTDGGSRFAPIAYKPRPYYTSMAHVPVHSQMALTS